MKWIKKKEIDIRICNLTKISSIFRFKLFKHSIEKIDHRIAIIIIIIFFYFQNLKFFPTRLNLFLFFFFRSFSSRKLVDYQRRQTRTFTCHKGRHRHTPRLTRIRRPLRRRERERESFQFVANLNVFVPIAKLYTDRFGSTFSTLEPMCLNWWLIGFKARLFPLSPSLPSPEFILSSFVYNLQVD